MALLKVPPKKTAARAGGSCGLWAERDIIAEALKTTHDGALNALLGAPVEVIGTEFAIGDFAGEDVEGGDQDLVRDGTAGDPRPAAGANAVVLVGKIRCAWCARRRPQRYAGWF